MSKILVPLTLFVNIVAILVMLIVVSSCNSIPSTSGSKQDPIYQTFPLATNIARTPFLNQGAQVSGRPDKAKISEIKSNSDLLGYSVESTVVSRSGPFRIRVLLDKQLYIKQATVISYPWDRGRDVCKRAFTDQFKGKGPKDLIQLGKDIDAMTGATISSRVMAEGVRDTIKLLKLIREK